MKVTQFGPGSLPLALAGWSTGIVSINSNATTTDGGLTAQNFVQRITANGSNVLLNPIVNFASGSNILLTLDQGPLPAQAYPSNTIRIHSTGGSGGNIITSNGSNSLAAVVNLKAGTGIALGVSGQDITITNTGSGGGGGGGSTDVIQTYFGTPDTAYEFDTSSLTGLTLLGSPDSEDANTTISGNYYIRDANGSYDWCGRYLTPPAAPWTAICKITDFYPSANYESAGMFLGVATPGNMDVIHMGYNNGILIQVERTTQNSFTSVINTAAGEHGSFYLGIKVSSSTSVDYLISMNGYIWRGITLARNPSITIASVGLCLKSENTAGSAAAYDFLRIWNSAKTFIGT